jgi:NADH:ubiquinone oxidoreductase subunit K
MLDIISNFFYFSFFFSLTFVLIVVSLLGLFWKTNILLTYLCCELLVVAFICFFLFLYRSLFLFKLQALLLIFLGLMAAELALGLVVFIRFYRLTKTIY